MAIPYTTQAKAQEIAKEKIEEKLNREQCTNSGEHSLAINYRNKALQWGCFASGGGNRAGMTLEQWNTWCQSRIDAGDPNFHYDPTKEENEQYYITISGYSTRFTYGRYEMYCHAEGEQTIATGRGSHSEGGNTKAFGFYSHTEGFNNTSEGAYSHTEGSDNTTYDLYTHAEGYNNQSVGNCSHTEGSSNKTYAENSRATGYNTIAGSNNFWNETTTYNQHDLVCYQGKTYRARRTSTNVLPTNTTYWSVQSCQSANGFYTKAGYGNQYVVGRYNDNTFGTLFEVGNGTSNDNRKNAFVVGEDGSITAQTSLKIGNTTLSEQDLISLLALIRNNTEE